MGFDFVGIYRKPSEKDFEMFRQKRKEEQGLMASPEPTQEEPKPSPTEFKKIPNLKSDFKDENNGIEPDMLGDAPMKPTEEMEKKPGDKEEDRKEKKMKKRPRPSTTKNPAGKQGEVDFSKSNGAENLNVRVVPCLVFMMTCFRILL